MLKWPILLAVIFAGCRGVNYDHPLSKPVVHQVLVVDSYATHKRWFSCTVQLKDGSQVKMSKTRPTRGSFPQKGEFWEYEQTDEDFSRNGEFIKKIDPPSRN